MRYSALLVTTMITLASCAICDGQSAYIERWATGTLTTGEPFESWRIHVVVPAGDDWLGSGIDGWMTGASIWYDNPVAGWTPRPDLFPAHADAAFDTYWTTARSYPNSSEWLDDIIYTTDLILEPTYLHLDTWGDLTFNDSADHIVWQGTALNPQAGAYGTIEFSYVTQLEPHNHDLTFTIPEPMTALLLAFGACGARGRR